MDKYASARAEARAELVGVDDAELVLVAFGSVGRIARALVNRLRKEGKKTGLVRPLTLYPFPDEALRRLAGRDVA